METIKCKECGKEISKKAYTCPNCGIKIKTSSLDKLVITVFIIVGILILAFGGIFAYKMIEKQILVNRYSGDWLLEIGDDIYLAYDGQETDEDEGIKLLLDETLHIEKENVYEGIGLSSCSLNEKRDLFEERCEESPAKALTSSTEKDKLAITFIKADGNPVLLCFEYTKKDTLSQISCEHVSGDKYNPELFAANGGLTQDFDIVYKKKR